VIIEPAPLVKVDNKNRARPLRAGGNRVVNPGQKQFSIANVSVGVIVISAGVNAGRRQTVILCNRKNGGGSQFRINERN
jgi:hypothetical protein